MHLITNYVQLCLCREGFVIDHSDWSISSLLQINTKGGQGVGILLEIQPNITQWITDKHVMKHVMKHVIIGLPKYIHCTLLSPSILHIYNHFTQLKIRLAIYYGLIVS